MGKYPLSEEDKIKVLHALEDIHPSKRDLIIANGEAFGRWLASACYDIWMKIKSFFQSVKDGIEDFIDWLFN